MRPRDTRGAEGAASGTVSAQGFSPAGAGSGGGAAAMAAGGRVPRHGGDGGHSL